VNQNSNPKESGSHGSAISEKFCGEVWPYQVLAGIQQAFGCSISEDPPKSLPCYHQQTNKASRKMPISRPVGKFYGRIHSETINTQLLSAEQKKTKNTKKQMMMKKKKKKTTKKRVEFKDAHHSICETVLLAALLSRNQCSKNRTTPTEGDKTSLPMKWWKISETDLSMISSSSPLSCLLFSSTSNHDRLLISKASLMKPCRCPWPP
jgi:hypothetical protein